MKKTRKSYAPNWSEIVKSADNGSEARPTPHWATHKAQIPSARKAIPMIPVAKAVLLFVRETHRGIVGAHYSSRYSAREFDECFTPAERETLERGEILTRGPISYLHLEALALIAFRASEAVAK